MSQIKDLWKFIRYRIRYEKIKNRLLADDEFFNGKALFGRVILYIGERENCSLKTS